MKEKNRKAYAAEQLKRQVEMAEWEHRVRVAAEELIQELPTLEGHPIPYNVAKKIACLQVTIGEKPLPLLKGDWEEARGVG